MNLLDLHTFVFLVKPPVSSAEVQLNWVKPLINIHNEKVKDPSFLVLDIVTLLLMKDSSKGQTF